MLLNQELCFQHFDDNLSPHCLQYVQLLESMLLVNMLGTIKLHVIKWITFQGFNLKRIKRLLVFCALVLPRTRPTRLYYFFMAEKQTQCTLAKKFGWVLALLLGFRQQGPVPDLVNKYGCKPFTVCWIFYQRALWL